MIPHVMESGIYLKPGGEWAGEVTKAGPMIWVTSE